MTHFGKIIVDESRVKWFCDGGYVNEKQVTVKSYPQFMEEKPPIEVRNQFRQAYNAYMNINGREAFLGVAFFNEHTKNFKADKVFGRG